MLVYSCVNMVPPKYGEYVYPQWAIGFGWVVALCSIVPMPAVAVYRIVMAKGSLMQVHHICQIHYYLKWL